MAPINILTRLKTLYAKSYGICLTVFYVAPFYVSSTTRPSPTLSRDAPSVIRARIKAVTLSCIGSTLAVSWLIIVLGNVSSFEALKLLGWWPIEVVEVLRIVLLTAILFAGPLFERGIAEGEWRDWIKGSRISQTLCGWIGWRNYVAGPVTEEIMFRSAIIPLHILAKVSPGRVVFVAPLYFGIAHVHHFYEFRLTHPDTSILAALLRSIFQFGYTTVFGWYATFVYLRTGSLPAVILAHAFCNWCGLPRLWGRVEPSVPLGPPVVKDKGDAAGGTIYAYHQLSIGWTIAYYTILVGGATGFYYALWPLTDSSHALVALQRTPIARSFSVTARRPDPRRALNIPPPFPVTKSCPEPSCSCPPTPPMPDGLPVDYDQQLNGTMVAYAQQILICTGQRDWTSRIEDDGKHHAWGHLARGLKRLLGRGGRYADPFNNILVSNSSLPPSSTSTGTQSASAFLFPSFQYFPTIPVQILESANSGTDLSTFVQAFLLPKTLSAMSESLPEARKAELTRTPELASEFADAVDLCHSPVILICGHGGRDLRCGVMAPVLEKEFLKVLQAKGFTPADRDGQLIDSPDHAHIGLISHIGGHKYAGNVIVYMPPRMKIKNSSIPHPLAGKGIWYGRIEPKHVQGIVEETILGGKVVADHFRGGIDRNGNILRL
ncbi:Sucrase/ferredoxin-like-domain-containing protein [Aspergillus coremiiformis]|uniref:intramembrane prenyl-peptidase Rce1 n=1 Tax=Aspergillus coremiiformis TaxID=138285 RepID=A0A5N6YX59_9EURO|nr:Sucrase/ferredoxin-like-domain-containing protein [Aspergillus coremiiformis]